MDGPFLTSPARPAGLRKTNPETDTKRATGRRQARRGGAEARRRDTNTKRIIPATIETTLAACAFVSPWNDLGLIRMISTRNLAMPVRTRYAENTIPSGACVLKQRAPSRQRIQKSKSAARNS